MRSPEEIKFRLEWLAHPCSEVTYDCDKCRYKDICDNTYSCDVSKEALSLIAQLEETISLMKIQMRGDCGCCKHGRDGDMKRCNECLLSREYHPLWEYEGLPEVEVYESEMPVLR